MGVCNTKENDAALEAKDPPVATAEEDGKPQPKPFTVDLNEPAVDVSAPLDDRDIELVQQTFARAALLGAENVGWVLFMNIFSIAPGAKNLFPFKDDDLATSTRMKAHGVRVVGTVATAVSLLRDLPTLVPVLHELGLKHVGYSVVPEHYDVVGQALIKSLQTALGPNMTPAVTNSYLKVYTLVKATMIEKCDYSKLAAPESAAAPAAEPAAEPEAEQAAPAAEPAPEVKEPEKAEETSPAEAASPAPVEGEATPAPTQEKKGKEEPKKEEKKETKKAPTKANQHTVKKRKEEDAKKKEEDAKKKHTEEEGNAEKPAEAEAPKEDKPTPEQELITAAMKGDDKTLAKLLKAGANVNATDADGKTALHWAAENGYEEICGRLSSNKKIKLNLKTASTKETPLHLACIGGHKDCAVMIVRGNNSTLKEKNKAGKVPVELTKDTQLATWMRAANPAGTPPPWQGRKL